ncbi:FMN-binding protein, partial [Verrucomicrobia bacterium]|nr:FMN-binding protein [Verrucomicrobiota bacterium]
MNGATLDGKVMKIDIAGKKVIFEAVVGGQKTEATYVYNQIHMVTMGGKKYTLTAKPIGGGSGMTNAAGGTPQRTRKEIENLIKTVGGSAPPWLATTKLNYPRTLDLNWTHPPEGKWNQNKNIGQFIWSTINENKGRWREGIRFMHFIVDRLKGDRVKRARAADKLGIMYFELFRDYPRAAYWFRQSGVPNGLIANCYFQMGNKDMAIEVLKGKPAGMSVIKLLGAMGETDKAVAAAKSVAKYSQRKHEVLLLAGDALRMVGRYKEAISFYQSVLTAGPARNKEYEKRYMGRAKDSIVSIQQFELFDLNKVKNGQHRASAVGYNGPIEVEVSVSSGRIGSVKVTKHREKQFYTSLTDTPAQIIRKQHVKGIDATSQATITSVAVINAAAK